MKEQRQSGCNLDYLTILIKTVWDTAHGDHGHAIHGYLRIGHTLLIARRHFKADRDYGEWFHGQGFVFGTEWARQMRLAAEHEQAVRSWWRQELGVRREPSMKRCLAALRTQPAPRIGRRQPAIPVLNDIEDALRAWESDHEAELADTLGPHLHRELDADKKADVVAEVLAVLGGK